MDHFVEAADWIVWQLSGTLRAQRLHRRLQGHLPGRRLPDARSSSPRSTPTSPTSSRQARHPIGQLGDRAGALTAEAAGWTGLPEGIAVAVGNVDAHVTAPAAGHRAGPDGRDHGHLDLPRDERRRRCRGARHVRRRRRRHHRRASGATRPARAASATSSAGSSHAASRRAYVDEAAERGLSVHELLTELAASRRSASTGWSRSTGTAATARCWSTTSCPAWCVGQTLATRPEDIYRALLESTAFGTRMIVEAFGAAGVPVTELVVAGGLLKNELLMQIYADVLDLPLSTHRLRPGPRARLGHPRGRRRRRLSRRRARPRRRWAGVEPRRLPARPGAGRGLRRALRRVPRAARLLRPRRQRRDAPAARHPQRGALGR